MQTIRLAFNPASGVALFFRNFSLIMIILIMFPEQGISQQKSTIEGTVFEEATEMPLSGAHVMINNSSYGTITGPDGSFRLIVKDFPVMLKVTHIGFEDRFFEVSEDIKDERLMLGVKFKAELLDGITISDQKLEVIFKDKSYSVLDFEFHENGLVLLIYRNNLKRSEIVLLSMMNDTLATITNVPGRASSLHRDCRNNIHYVANDSAYQLYYSGEGMSLIHPVDIARFIPVANAFYAYYDDNYYYGMKKIQDQVIEYIRYDSLSRKYHPFRLIADAKTLQILKDNPRHGYLLQNLKKERDPFKDADLMFMGAYASAEAQRQALQLSRTQTIEAHYLKTCVYHEVYAPLFSYKDEIVIFNHPASVIEFLSSTGQMKRATHISYHNKKNWEALILRDDISGIFYTMFTKNNRISIQAIDIESGELGESNILYFPLVKKVLVRNGYAYFTYRQPGSIDRTVLFRQKLRSAQHDYAGSN